MLQNRGWDLHVFSSVDDRLIHPELRDVTVHRLLRTPLETDPTVRQTGIPWPFKVGAARLHSSLDCHWDRTCRAARLARTIRVLKPDVLHTLEMQHAAYLTLESRERMRGREFPPWIYSSWGTDFFYHGRDPAHEPRIRAVLAACGYHIADCERDVQLAREYGFRGETAGIFVPGLDLSRIEELRPPGLVSHRKTIALKGYHYESWVSRALVALEALHRVADLLHDFEIVIYSATDNVRYAAEYISRITGLRCTILPQSSHEEILALMGRARLALAVNVSDGTPSTMLEAMAMGAFPIQSDTVSTREWITDGWNGLLVPPENPAAIAAALRRALGDDVLVDRGASVNAQLTAERLDRRIVEPRIIAMYERVARQAGVPHAG